MYMRNPNRDKSVSFDTTATLPDDRLAGRDLPPAPMQDHEMRITGSTGGTSLMAGRLALSATGHRHQLAVQPGLGALQPRSDARTPSESGHATHVQPVRREGRAGERRLRLGGRPDHDDGASIRADDPRVQRDGGYSGPLLAAQAMDNPLAIVNLREDKNTTNYLLGNLFAAVELMTDSSSVRACRTRRVESGAGLQLATAPAVPRSGSGDDQQLRQQTALFENTITGRHSWGRATSRSWAA